MWNNRLNEWLSDYQEYVFSLMTSNFTIFTFIFNHISFSKRIYKNIYVQKSSRNENNYWNIGSILSMSKWFTFAGLNFDFVYKNRNIKQNNKH